MPKTDLTPLAPTPEEQQTANLRGWCEAILCELVGPDMEPSVGVVDQLTQVVECRAKELLAAARATDQQRIGQLKWALRDLGSLKACRAIGIVALHRMRCSACGAGDKCVPVDALESSNV